MQKGALINSVARRTQRHPELVAEIVNATLAQIEEAIWNDDQVILPGFGTFYQGRQGAGTVTNIRTKEKQSYAAQKVARFRAGPQLKRALRDKKQRT